MKKIYVQLTLSILLVIITNFQLKAQCPSTTVPYYEGFQSITTNNQFPTCWTSSSPSVTCLTYTTGTNNYAAFYYNPGGTNYFGAKVFSYLAVLLIQRLFFTRPIIPVEQIGRTFQF